MNEYYKELILSSTECKIDDYRPRGTYVHILKGELWIAHQGRLYIFLNDSFMRVSGNVDYLIGDNDIISHLDNLRRINEL